MHYSCMYKESPEPLLAFRQFSRLRFLRLQPPAALKAAALASSPAASDTCG